jgi:RNA polymerase sigma-70 factor (ECF subfamily)
MRASNPARRRRRPRGPAPRMLQICTFGCVRVSHGESVVTQEEMIAKIQQGEVSYFEQLYQAHKTRIYSLCRRMIKNVAIAEELTQETFLTAYRRLDTFRNEAAFSTWLHRIAVNVVLMHVRQLQSRGGQMSSLEDLQTFGENETPRDTIGTSDLHLVGTLNRIALMRAIDQLAPGYRLVLVLHDIEGYEHVEIAEMLGCSTGNTKSQLHKARMRLRLLLRGQARADRVAVAKPAAREAPAARMAA